MRHDETPPFKSGKNMFRVLGSLGGGCRTGNQEHTIQPVTIVHLFSYVLLGCGREDACARMFPAWGSGMQLV